MRKKISFQVLKIANDSITNSSGPAIFVRCNRVNWCTYMTLKSDFYNRVFVDDRVRYSRVSLILYFNRFAGVAVWGFNAPEWFISDIGCIFAGGMVRPTVKHELSLRY
jgi:hypothetical protein